MRISIFLRLPVSDVRVNNTSIFLKVNSEVNIHMSDASSTWINASINQGMYQSTKIIGPLKTSLRQHSYACIKLRNENFIAEQLSRPIALLISDSLSFFFDLLCFCYIVSVYTTRAVSE